MNKTRIVSAALCFVALAWASTSCKKDKPHEGEKMTIGASINQAGNDNTKTFIAPTLGGTEVRWSVGDEIRIFGTGDTEGTLFSLSQEQEEGQGAGCTSAKFEGETPTGKSPYYAVYPSTGTKTANTSFSFSMPEEISYENDGAISPYSSLQKHNGPMVGMSVSGSDLQFQNAMSVVFLALKGVAKITKIVLTDLNTSNPPLNGTLSVTVDSETGEISSSSMTDGTHQLTLNINGGVQLGSSYSMFCFPVPTGAFQGDNMNVKIQIYDREYGAEREIMTITKKLKDGVVANKAYAVVEKDVLPLILPHKYTFNSHTVRFSRGNLWYDGSNCHFEQTQYDATDTPGHIGLFYYNSDVNTAATGSSPKISRIFSNSGTSNPNSSFTVERLTGKCLVMSNYDYKGLRDLTSSSKSLHARVKVNSKKGIIFLPDDWSVSDHSGFPYGESNFNTNFTIDDWVALEADGAVFFPTMAYNADEGRYWSSSFTSGSSSAPYCYFNTSKDAVTSSVPTNAKYNVRLMVIVNTPDDY